jgi:hypothetical protein
MSERNIHCHACGRRHTFDGPIPREAVCDACASALKCCLTCRFHDPSAYNECSEPSAERVLDKDRSNFCDYHSPREQGTAGSRNDGAGDGARSELERLFGKK